MHCQDGEVQKKGEKSLIIKALCSLVATSNH